ncbi:hypothetical protein CTAYLR_004016 [Chrysophaeum taylorii]|uniref:Uncharacterized protein n=1 Tax=Chrysophaeum taylorii TaxID=2483200 RepID=A0AAD7U9U2_9STRA|nr:hypothetical protein CTAYLR_004016 [Chrysophaeum taylorii]
MWWWCWWFPLLAARRLQAPVDTYDLTSGFCRSAWEESGGLADDAMQCWTQCNDLYGEDTILAATYFADDATCNCQDSLRHRRADDSRPATAHDAQPGAGAATADDAGAGYARPGTSADDGGGTDDVGTSTASNSAPDYYRAGAAAADDAGAGNSRTGAAADYDRTGGATDVGADVGAATAADHDRTGPAADSPTATADDAGAIYSRAGTAADDFRAGGKTDSRAGTAADSEPDCFRAAAGGATDSWSATANDAGADYSGGTTDSGAAIVADRSADDSATKHFRANDASKELVGPTHDRRFATNDAASIVGTSHAIANDTPISSTYVDAGAIADVTPISAAFGVALVGTHRDPRANPHRFPLGAALVGTHRKPHAGANADAVVVGTNRRPHS